MSALCDGLMGSSPTGPGDDMGWLDAALGKFVGDTAHFLDRPTDQWRRLRVAWLFGGGD
jgi:hypothetical protein